MRTHRTELIAVTALALLTAAAAGCGARPAPAPEPRGVIQASIAAPPTAVQAVLVTVSGGAISGAMRAALTVDQAGHWSGRVLDVPPGTGLTVTAYAYAGPSVPEDPVADTAGLIYRGVKSNVTVTAGALTAVTVPMLPWPDGGGEFGVNTPPHLTGVGHATFVASNGDTTVSATAVDPDTGATLTYAWTDDVGGTFTGGDEGQPARFSNREPGATVSAGWAPPAGFVGTATLRVTVSDGVASATTTFPIGVGSGIDVGLVFDVLPVIQLLGATSQDLPPAGTSTIAWRLVYPEGAGPDAPGVLTVDTAWTDSCGGAFSPATDQLSLSWFEPTGVQQVTWTAPADVADLTQCTLTLTVGDEAGAEAFSQLHVWVSPGAVVAPPPGGAMVIFVSSAMVSGGTFDGSMGAADLFCQGLASAGQVPPGTYRALMSFSGADARDRIPDAAFVLQDGRPVASSKADLLDGTIQAPIGLDELGRPYEGEVWTGSNQDGTRDGTLTQCSDWTSSFIGDHQGTAGYSSVTDRQWLQSDISHIAPYWCSDLKPVYCVQISGEPNPL